MVHKAIVLGTTAAVVGGVAVRILNDEADGKVADFEHWLAGLTAGR